MSDLVGNHIVGFPTRWLKSCKIKLCEQLLYFSENNGDNDTSECMPRAVDEFPDNFFTLKQTQDGAMAVHILLAIYMFGALAIVCDDYFVPALEAICERKKNTFITYKI